MLVYYLDGADTPTESLLALWREETQRNNTPFPLWRRYFRAGNAQLKKLILFGLDRDATDRDLLDSLSFLHSFLPMPKELLTRYKLACDQESDPQRNSVNWRRILTLARPPSATMLCKPCKRITPIVL